MIKNSEINKASELFGRDIPQRENSNNPSTKRDRRFERMNFQRPYIEKARPTIGERKHGMKNDYSSYTDDEILKFLNGLERNVFIDIPDYKPTFYDQGSATRYRNPSFSDEWDNYKELVEEYKRRGGQRFFDTEEYDFYEE